MNKHWADIPPPAASFYWAKPDAWIDVEGCQLAAGRWPQLWVARCPVRVIPDIAFKMLKIPSLFNRPISGNI